MLLLCSEASQECCYYKNINLIQQKPSRGSVNAYSPSKWEAYAIFDLIPFIACCFNEDQCSKYYTRRPSANCDDYEPSQLGLLYLIHSELLSNSLLWLLLCLQVISMVILT